MNEGETHFARFLSSLGHGWEFEPDLKIATRPDFLVSTSDGESCVCEVKQFTTWGLLEGAKPGALIERPLEVALRPVRRRISRAAKQLSGLKESGLPLVAVLTNPFDRPVPLNPEMVVSAMYGDMSYAVQGHGQSAPEFEPRFGRNGKLQKDHQYLSAVAILSLHWPPSVLERLEAWLDERKAANPSELIHLEDFLALLGQEGVDCVRAGNLAVIETLSSAAVPLPPTVLAGPGATRWKLARADSRQPSA